MGKPRFRTLAAAPGVRVLPLCPVTLGLEGNVTRHKHMLCEDQPSMQQISRIQLGMTSKTNNRAAFKMNFRFQDEKETQGHELLGDTCSEQGPMPKKGPTEEPENKGFKGGHDIHSSSHKLLPDMLVVPGFVLSSPHVTRNKSDFLPS